MFYNHNCGKDERNHIFNMVDNITLGELTAHTGAITCLDFFEESYLLSGSDDKSICIWRTHDWMCVHILGGHKASINSVSVHPSGKLAVSVAQDNTLKVWNLVQGRIAFTRRLKGSANIVKWQKPAGNAYLLVFGKKIEVYATNDNTISANIEHAMRINQADFIGESGLVVTICEDKMLRLFNSGGQELSRVDFNPLGSRIRNFCQVFFSENQADDDTNAIVLATSNGKIVIVDIGQMMGNLDGNKVEEVPLDDAIVSSFDIKAEPRLTCISAWDLAVKKESRKKNTRKRKKNISNVKSEDSSRKVRFKEGASESDFDCTTKNSKHKNAKRSKSKHV